MNEVRPISTAQSEATEEPAALTALKAALSATANAPSEPQALPAGELAVGEDLIAPDLRALSAETKADSLDAPPTVPAPPHDETPAEVVVAPPSPTQVALEAAMPGEAEPVDHGIGVLLVNLGTPDAADAPAVRRYLKEFLTDRRVIENNSTLWKMLLNGVILPLRSRRKARDYQKIWNNEKTSHRLRPSPARRRRNSPAFSSRSGSTSSSTGRCVMPIRRLPPGLRDWSSAAATASS